ncbi:MAG: hypothetical protein KR126chlam3_00797 [Chlamydiae bacterium]|nr:hypothetical protein [Chlamydiota bacterium]
MLTPLPELTTTPSTPSDQILGDIGNEDISARGKIEVETPPPSDPFGRRSRLNPTDYHLAPKDQRLDLERYKRLKEGKELFLTNTEELSDLIRFGEFVCISGEYNVTKGEGEETVNRNMELEKDLRKGGFRYVKIRGHYGGVDEESFLVFTIDGTHTNIKSAIGAKKLQDLIALGNKYNQDSILYSSWSQQFYYYTDTRNTDTLDTIQYGEGHEFYDIVEEDNDNYSEVVFSDGTIKRFRLNIDFDHQYTIPQYLTHCNTERRKKYENFYKICEDVPPGQLLNDRLHITPQPCKEKTCEDNAKRVVILVRGLRLLNDFAEMLAKRYQSDGYEDIELLSSDAHIYQINLEKPGANFQEFVRPEMIRRDHQAFAEVIDKKAQVIIRAGMGRETEFLDPYVQYAKLHGYEVRIIRVGGIYDDGLFPYGDRNVKLFEHPDATEISFSNDVVISQELLSDEEALSQLTT